MQHFLPRRDKLLVMTNKTQITGINVNDFLDGVTPPRRAEDARVLDAMYRDITGFRPRMWGPSIVGYGQYHYVYKSGREGDSLASGFSPRKAALSIYVMPGYTDYSAILARLGKHKIGKSCLYVNKLADIDLAVLEELIRAGLADLAKIWPVSAT
jgi:Domain of unknown function (DU1801)